MKININNVSKRLTRGEGTRGKNDYSVFCSLYAWQSVLYRSRYLPRMARENHLYLLVRQSARRRYHLKQCQHR